MERNCVVQYAHNKRYSREFVSSRHRVQRLMENHKYKLIEHTKLYDRNKSFVNRRYRNIVELWLQTSICFLENVLYFRESEVLCQIFPKLLKAGEKSIEIVQREVIEWVHKIMVLSQRQIQIQSLREDDCFFYLKTNKPINRLILNSFF